MEEDEGGQREEEKIGLRAFLRHAEALRRHNTHYF
jgi:hypothetical protein